MSDENEVPQERQTRALVARQVETAGSGEIVRRLAYEPGDFPSLERASTLLASSGLVPDALRGKPQDVMLVLWTAREYGFGAMQGLQNLHVIKGRVTFSAMMVQALVERSGLAEYLMLVSSTAEGALYETKRKGQPRVVTMGYTWEQATKAGLTGKENWKNNREAMLRARALTAISRAVYGDVIAGIYTPEELAELTPQEYAEVAGEAQAAREVQAEAKAASVVSRVQAAAAAAVTRGRKVPIETESGPAAEAVLLDLQPTAAREPGED